MKKGADALKGIHGNLWVSQLGPPRVTVSGSDTSLVGAANSNINKVDATMDSIREQMDLTNEISDAISNPVNMGIDVDDVRDHGLHALAVHSTRLTYVRATTGGAQERARGA